MTDCGCATFPASLGNVTFGASVGIGTSAPAGPLDVSGSGGTVAAYIGPTDDNYGVLVLRGGSPGTFWELAKLRAEDPSPDGFSLLAVDGGAATPVLTATMGGNLGIGTTAHGAKLVVSGLGSSQIEQGSATTAADLFGASTDRVRLTVGNTNAGTAQGATSRSTALQFYGYDPAGTALQPMFELGTDAEQTGTQSLFVYDDAAKAYRLYLGSTGCLGIGTTDPVAALDVDNAAAPQLVVRGGATSSIRVFPTCGTIASVEAFATSDVTLANYSRLRLTVDGATAGVIADATGTGSPMPMTFSAGGAERLRITTDGNVGIGTPGPATPLHIKLDAPNVIALVDTAATDQSSQYALGEAGELIWQIYKPANSHDLRFFRSNKGDQVTIQDGTGNVGIGTTGPSYPLDVAGSVNTATAYFADGVKVADPSGCYYA